MGFKSFLLLATLACLVVSGGSARTMTSSDLKKQESKLLATEVRPMKYQGALFAELEGDKVEGGDKKSGGFVMLAIFKNGTDYSIRYAGQSRTMDFAEPSSFTINTGTEGASGAAQIDFKTLTDTTWKNDTYVLKSFKFLQRFIPYEYEFRGKASQASTVVTVTSGNLKTLVDNMVETPSGYHATFVTATYPEGAARGQFEFVKPWWKRN